MLNAEIIAGCENNNRREQRRLYEFCYPILARVGYRYGKNQEDIQEIINESFLKIIKNVSRLKELKLSTEAYVWKVGIHTAIDLFRKNSSYKENIRLEASMPEEWNAAEGVDWAKAEHDIESKAILAFIRQLPDLTREVLNLFAVDGYSHKEISNILKISEELSRWHLYKGRKILMTKLGNVYNIKTKK